ncbi:MAG: hypothetical protein ABH803_02185 [Candidatus Micrarchaeota archaeon]
MKGFYSITIALLALTAVFIVHSINQKALEENRRQTKNILALEEKQEFEANLIQAYALALQAEGEGKEKIVNAAQRLKELEKVLLKENAVVWFGSLSLTEEQELLKKIAREKTPLKCKNCFSFKETTMDYEGKIVLKSVSILWTDGSKVIVSKNGEANAPSSLIGRIGLGASYYANNVSAVIFLGEGFN